MKQKAIIRQFWLKALFFLVGSALWTTAATATPLTICVEDRFWPPGSFFVEGQPVGTHVAIIEQAIKTLPYSVNFIAMPWNRCLTAVEHGDVDAIMSASYIEDRNRFLKYPAEATSTLPHPSSLGTVDFVAVANIETDLNGIDNGALPPQPIGIPIGYITIDIYRQRGAQVVGIANYNKLFELLRRGRVKSLILSGALADIYIKHGNHQKTFKTKSLPGRSGPLYLGFSRKSPLSSEQISEIWQSIAHVRSDKIQMQKINDKAQKEAYICLQDNQTCE